MKQLHGNPNTKITATDNIGQGGAHHVYLIEPISSPPNFEGDSCSVINPFEVRFQNGPIKEEGVNGCHQEDLLAIVIDRLQSFQAGPFACRENALALTKCQEAMHWMDHRTKDRERRQVEVTNVR